MRTTAEVLQNHLSSFGVGNLEGILARQQPSLHRMVPLRESKQFSPYLKACWQNSQSLVPLSKSLTNPLKATMPISCGMRKLQTMCMSWRQIPLLCVMGKSSPSPLL